MSEVWTINEYVQKGWQCPVCGKVNAPWMMQCTCDGNRVGVSYSDRTTPSITGFSISRTCGLCEYADPVVYTSIPPKRRCRITGDYNTEDHVCTNAVVKRATDPDAGGAE